LQNNVNTFNNKHLGLDPRGRRESQLRMLGISRIVIMVEGKTTRFFLILNKKIMALSVPSNYVCLCELMLLFVVDFST